MVLLPEVARDLVLLVLVFLRFVGGADVLRLADPVVTFPGVFFAGVVGVAVAPRLPGRLTGEGVVVSGSMAMGSLARRPREASSSSSVAARLRDGTGGVGLAVEIGIRDELLRKAGLL